MQDTRYPRTDDLSDDQRLEARIRFYDERAEMAYTEAEQLRAEARALMRQGDDFTALAKVAALAWEHDRGDHDDTARGECPDCAEIAEPLTGPAYNAYLDAEIAAGRAVPDAIEDAT